MDEQFAIQEEGFATVSDVLNAMRDHDEELVDIVRDLCEQKGEGKPFRLKRLRKKLKVIGPFVNLDALMQSISVKIVDSIGSSWDEMFGVLMKFKAREGHCNVPGLHCEGTFPLGSWVGTQRQTKDTMSAERRQRLNDIGFVWDVLDAQWEEAFAALMQFKAREGHCNVPERYREGNFPLGSWVNRQRLNTKMSDERKQRLNEIGFIWEPHEARWEEGLASLMAFKARESHTRVPTSHLEGTFNLGIWVANQRSNKDTCPLNANGGSMTLGLFGMRLTLGGRWIEALKKYKAREGHVRRVPYNHIESTFPLGQWATYQRQYKNPLSAERKRRLDDIGFVWDTNEAKWEDGIFCLREIQSTRGTLRRA